MQALLSRGRRPTKIMIISDEHLPDFVNLENRPGLTVHNGKQLTYSSLLKYIHSSEETTVEDTLFVVAAGLYSVLEVYTAVSFDKTSAPTLETDIQADQMSRIIVDYMISEACDIWNHVLLTAKHSDIIFMQMPHLILTDKAPYLKGSQKFYKPVRKIYYNVYKSKYSLENFIWCPLDWKYARYELFQTSKYVYISINFQQNLYVMEHSL